MTETTVYLVVTEKYYGGEERKIFLTLPEARAYRDSVFAETENKLDIIIQEFILNTGSEPKTSFCE